MTPSEFIETYEFKNKEFIDMLLHKMGVSSLTYEVAFLDMLIEAKKNGKRIIIHPARMPINKLLRAEAIFTQCEDSINSYINKK